MVASSVVSLTASLRALRQVVLERAQQRGPKRGLESDVAEKHCLEALMSQSGRLLRPAGPRREGCCCDGLGQDDEHSGGDIGDLAAKERALPLD